MPLSYSVEFAILCELLINAYEEAGKMNQDFAEHFAADWINSWNAHNLDRVLSHYADDFEMSSPMIAQVVGEPSGMLRGKAAVGAYWQKALGLIPDLHFETIAVLVGVSSLMICYKGPRGRLAAEVFHFGEDGKVIRAFAHYAT
jgi:hypothetical protein